MLKPNRAGLDYYELVRKAKRLPGGNGPKLRVALLADVSTQHLVPLLRALFADNGFDAEIYEAGFDTVQLEAFNPQSGLYTFAPQVVVVLQSVMKLKQLYYDSVLFSAEDLRHLIAVVGASQVVVGTDYPTLWNRTPVDRVLAVPGLSDEDRAAIFGDTATRLLKLKS